MYGRPGVIYGFHGCDRSVAEAVLSSHTHHLRSSENGYDWLGHGTYFWEASPERALQFVQEAKKRKQITKGKIRHPYVIGAVIELGNCLNLLDHSGLMEMQVAYELLKANTEAEGKELPKNRMKDKGGAFTLRELDCAVLEYLHISREGAGLPGYDTVIGALWEGDELYSGAGITNKNHVQVCVKTKQSIRGYFRVRELENIDLAQWNAHPQQARIPQLPKL